MKTDYVNSAMYNRLYMIMQYPNALALRVCLETGMRIGDVLAMTKYSLQGRTIRFTAQKTGKKCKKVISQDLANRLREIQGKEFIFTGRFGDKPRSRQTVWKDIKKASKIIGAKQNIGAHSARKTYAVEMLHKDGLKAVQRELQHDSPTTTMVYAFSDMLTNTDKAENECVELSESTIEKIADSVVRKLGNN